MPGLICSALCSTDCFDIYSTPDLSRPVQLYQILCAAGSAYCVLTVAVLILSSVWPASVYMPLVLLTTQSLSVIHAMTQKHLCSTVQLVHQYYAASLGFVYGALTFASGLYLLSSSLRTSNWAMILLYYAELFTGVGWMYMWTAIIFSRILRKNAQQYVGGGDFSVFLLMRCACVPMESKKMLVYTPPFLLGIFFFTECSLTRELSCDVPLQPFIFVSGVVFFVVSFFSCASLHFSREGVHADSTLQSEEIILLPRLTTSFGVLTTLRIVCLFGLVWGTIGLNWVTYAGPGCDERLTKVAIFGYQALFFGCCGCLILISLCKIEACFPVRLSPKLFEHGSRPEDSLSTDPVNHTLNSSRLLSRLLTMYCGFLVANPDWYEAPDESNVAHRSRRQDSVEI